MRHVRLSIPVSRSARVRGTPLHPDRPTRRGQCKDGPRPCPWLSCRYHLYLDIRPVSGTLVYAHGLVELEAMQDTCALDVADRGRHTLEEVSQHVQLTRERTRQLQEVALAKIRRALTPATRWR